jgi:hypothetical protein
VTLPKDVPIQLVGNDKYQLTVDYLLDGVPVNLTGETVTFKIYNDKSVYITLTDGSGLTISPTIGRIVIALTSAQTESLIGKVELRHVLRLDTPAEKTLMNGKVSVYQVV